MHEWTGRAERVIAGGATHDSWASTEPIVFDHGSGAFKWDTDGKQYVDFWMGHGALILGHNPPAIVEALAKQLHRGTHLSGNHTILVQWAEKVTQMVPSAEKVRFCASGTEATLLAMRLARAYTSRPVIVRIDGHFHGWHDEALSAAVEDWPAGAHPESATNVELVAPYDLDAMEAVLAYRNVAAVILEPGGGSSGTLPYDAEFLRSLRELTERYDTLLIFDEVMSGFRFAPGGVQQIASVMPDITTLSKVLCGGLPGAAVAGRCDVMECFDAAHKRKVVHAGTFNGNPLSASAGLATLGKVDDGYLQRTLNTTTAQFVEAVNERAQQVGVDVRLFHQFSIFHLVIGAQEESVTVTPSEDVFWLIQKNSKRHNYLKAALAQEGIDLHKSHGWISACHTEEVLYSAICMFHRAFERLSLLADHGGLRYGESTC